MTACLQRPHLQGEDGQKTGETSTTDATRDGIGSTSGGSSSRASLADGGTRAGGASRSGRVGRARCTSARGGSARGSSCTGNQRTGLGRGEEASNAALNAVGELLGGFGRAVTLVALGGALVGRYDLGGVGARSAQAGSLAGDIAGVASGDTANLRRNRYRRSGGGRRSAGDGGRLGKSAGSEGDERSGVLHFGNWVA